MIMINMENLNVYLFHRKNRVRRIKRNTKNAVSYFQNRRWLLVTFFEQMSGFWPHQSKIKKYSIQLFSYFISLAALATTGNELREHGGVDTNITIECCLLILFYLGMFVKLTFALICQNRRRKIYERIIKHFEMISDPEEVVLLNKGAEGGFKYTAYYMCIAIALLSIFNGAPVLFLFYDYLFNHCEFTMQMPIPLNYGFDHSKYWYIIALHFIMWTYTTIFIEFAYDLSYLLQVRHATALFKIVGMRLRKASEHVSGFKRETMNGDAAERSYSLISSAIDLHSECFEVVKLIEKTYSLNWFIMLLLSTAGFGAGAHLVSTKFHDPIDAFRYTSAFLLVLLHFQMVFYGGQCIIDSAESVSDACAECKWYGLPKKSCKLLTMMMIRTSIPCEITGAKLFPLSMETFSKMLKAGLSYYTVFRTN